MHAGSKALAYMKHVRPHSELWRSVGSPSMDPHGQLSVPGSPPSPCTRNLKEGPEEKSKVHTQSLAVPAAVQEKLCLSSSPLTHACNTYTSRKQGTLMGPMSQTEKQAQIATQPQWELGKGAQSSHKMCEGANPFAPVSVNPEAAMALLCHCSKGSACSDSLGVL